jgi:hypothetical protein
MSDAIVFVSIALFIVYEAREGRWGGFLGAVSGQYKIAPSSSGSSSGGADSNATVQNAGTANATVTPGVATVQPPSTIK